MKVGFRYILIHFVCLQLFVVRVQLKSASGQTLISRRQISLLGLRSSLLFAAAVRNRLPNSGWWHCDSNGAPDKETGNGNSSTRDWFDYRPRK